jgi:hypothetical protein
MEAGDLLPPLQEQPEDARGQVPFAEADSALYRLGLRSLPVLGLAEQLKVGDVRVHFVRGPVRAQQTVMRQRYGLPIVFDKAMRRREVGEGELLAVFSIEESPVPEDLDQSWERWRARALAAAGLVASVLDERVVGEQLFEDAVLLRAGEFVGAVDMRAGVRTFLPFDVTAADTSALERLAELDLSERDAAARAARLYRRAALEGPTADAFAMLWVAAECFSDRHSPSRPEIEQALRDSGLDPESLPISVGRFIGLRGEVQHHGLEADDRLRTAYYEMEAVVRALIRQHIGLTGGWWAASDNVAGFADPFPDALAELHGPGDTDWHADALPPAETPEPERLPCKITNPIEDPRITIDEGIGEAKHLIAAVIADALEWQDQNASLEIHLGAPAEAPAEVTLGANANRIFIREERLEGLLDEEQPQVMVNLVWDLHALVGTAIAQRAGLVSRDEGVVVIEAFGSFGQYHRLVTHGEFDADALQLPGDHDPLSLGKLAGWAAAGDARALKALESLPTPERALAQEIVDALREDPPGAPLKVLQLAARG